MVAKSKLTAKWGRKVMDPAQVGQPDCRRYRSFGSFYFESEPANQEDLMKKFQVFLLIALLVSSLVVPVPKAAKAATLPTNFQESIVFSGLTQPTNLRFASDGRVFVAEKSGIIKVFDNLSDTTPTIFADLRTNTHNFWDRGLLGMALDPNFPNNPYVYVLYTHDAAIGGTAPRWGTVGGTSDGCPTPPGATTDGCVVSGRLSRLQANGNVMTGSEQVLIEDWCQQFPSHSIGELAFGPDGALYVSGGDGASFNYVDYGQTGNPCGDPPGGTLTAPTAEGGALRSQSLRRPAGEPVTLDGTVLRVDPATGLGLSDNPLAGSSNTNARRIIASGMRNPFRFTFRPGTNELWVGDVGWSTWEEINRITSPTAAVTNFGWPCYEGNNNSSAIQSGYQGANLTLCNNLYTSGSVSAPYYAYQHGVQVVSGETCNTSAGSVISGITFYNGGSYPTSYNGAIFFADHSRNCIWVMFPGSNGLPDKTKISNFILGAANPVDLVIGPGGDLFYVDFDGGTIRRVQYVGGGNQSPVAVIAADPTNGPAPLTVNFDGTGSSDPDSGDGITAYSWDLNGDGVYGDSTSAITSYTYNTPGSYNASLKVTDKHSATGTSSVTISANNTAPVAFIDNPAACPSGSPCWSVGQTINFSGHATDQQQGTLPASTLSWAIILHHCAVDLNSCHTHELQTFIGIASGSFTAPDHDYPAYLELQLTATDSGGLQNTSSVVLYPRTVNFTLQSSPSGLQLNINGVSGTTPFVHAVIVNSNNSVSAPTPQTLNGVRYAFQSWSDSGGQTHNIPAGTTNATYTANYTPVSADVQIVKTGTLSAGKITYTLQVKNNGPAQAQGVVVSDNLPNKVQYFSISTTQGTCIGGSTVTCQIGTLNNSQTVTITLVVNVMKAAGFITNTASVTVSSNSPDLNTSNNSSTVQVKAR
jgi:uncharacterized repeat protein (TIGR01451 family)